MAFARTNLDICSTVCYQMRMLRVLAALSIQHELERLPISCTGGVRVADGCWDHKYLGSRYSMSGESRLAFVTDGGVDI